MEYKSKNDCERNSDKIIRSQVDYCTNFLPSTPSNGADQFKIRNTRSCQYCRKIDKSYNFGNTGHILTSKGKHADSLVTLYYLKAQFEPLRSHETLQEGASSVRCSSPLVRHCYSNNPTVFALKSRLSRPKLLRSLEKTLKHVLLNVPLVPVQHLIRLKPLC